MNPWLLLILAGLLEVTWAIGLRWSAGFTRLWPSVWTIGAMLASFYLLALAVRGLPLGLAYTVWVGIGAVGATVAGRLLFEERLGLAQAACMVLVIAGIAGLRLAHGPAGASAIAP